MSTSDTPIPRPPNRGDAAPIAELDEDECFDLLHRAEVGRLALQLSSEGVDIFPVNFVLDGRSILLRTAGGTKLDGLKAHPLVAFEVDHFDYFEHSAWSVVVKGSAAHVEDHDERFALLNVDIDTWHPERKPHFVRITPSLTTGRRFTIHRRVEP